MYGALSPGDVIVADALFDNSFIACEAALRAASSWLHECRPGARGSRTLESRPDGDVIVWQRP